MHAAAVFMPVANLHLTFGVRIFPFVLAPYRGSYSRFYGVHLILSSRLVAERQN